MLDVLEYMADAVDVPILWWTATPGTATSTPCARFVRKLGERGIAGVCLEDKLFPKANSFVGEGQALAEVDEFCGRLKAGKDSQTDDDFVIVARTEALISGHPMEEALYRAHAYVDAGADAVLIHSKKAHAREIFEFCERFGDPRPGGDRAHHVPRHPHRAVSPGGRLHGDLGQPPVARFAERHARHRRAHPRGPVVARSGRPRPPPVKDIFRLVGNAELEAAERRYLPAGSAPFGSGAGGLARRGAGRADLR